MVEAGDPVGTGLVESLAHPGGNVTGTTNLSAGLSAKRLEYLKQLVPAAARVAVVKHPSDPDAALALRQMEAAAPQLGLELVPVNANGNSDLSDAFDAATGGRADAAAAILEPELSSLFFQRFAAARRLPTIYAHRTQVVPYRPDMPDWGLVAYAVDRAALYRRAAYYVDRILKGARPAELPVEQPTKFDLVINLKTAQGLGLTIPQSVFQQATEVIQ